jgi:hypothetical protein
MSFSIQELAVHIMHRSDTCEMASALSITGKNETAGELFSVRRLK